MPSENVRQISEFHREYGRRPIDHGAGGPHDPSMEVRMAVIEKTVQIIERDLTEIKGDQRSMLKGGWAAFILTWVGLIGLGGGLAGLMARGFGWL